MRRILFGLAVGLVLGSSFAAYAATVCSSGVLKGWTVRNIGKKVCDDPAVNADMREIYCD